MMKKLKNGVAILGAIMLLANLFLPGLVVFAEGEEEPAAPVAEEPAAPAAEEPTAPAAEEPAAPAAEEPAAPAVDPEEPVAESTILGIQSVEKQSELSELSSLDNGLSTFDINPCGGKKSVC